MSDGPKRQVIGIVGPPRWRRRTYVTSAVRWYIPDNGLIQVDGRPGVGTYAEDAARKRGLEVRSLRLRVPVPEGVTPARWPDVQAARFVDAVDLLMVFTDGRDEHTQRYAHAGAQRDKPMAVVYVGESGSYSTVPIDVNLPVLPAERTTELFEILK